MGSNQGRQGGGELIARVTLDEMLGWRDRSLELYGEAFELYETMTARIRDKLREVGEAENRACGMLQVPKGKSWEKRTEGREKYDQAVRADLDRAMWNALLQITGMGALMDAKARQEFEETLSRDPPEITADNVRATFRQMKEDAGMIFRRGVVNVFKNLSREYRSHDGFKIGHRIVLGYVLSDSGYLHHGRTRDELVDADRIMHVLDGEQIHEGWSSSLVRAIESADTGSFSGIRPGTADTDYWHIKWFKNRNAHLYPKRKDLLRRVNRLIAQHFGEAVGEGPDAAGARRYTRTKPHHHEVVDFYPTPPAVVQRMIDAAELQPGLEVLEPSAGEGAIVQGILAAGIRPDCVEIDPDRADMLRDMLPPGAVVEMDFLRMLPEPEYDRVLMNPPFGKGAGVQHVLHGLRFLKPGGRLLAILNASLAVNQDGPSQELMRLVRAWGGKLELLPQGSFREAGTNVLTVLIHINKPVFRLEAPAEQKDEAA